MINCELKQSGKLIDEIYIKDVHCSYAVGYLLRLAEVNLENAAARFGTFYLDNLSKNGVALTQETRDDEYMLKFVVRAELERGKIRQNQYPRRRGLRKFRRKKARGQGVVSESGGEI